MTQINWGIAQNALAQPNPFDRAMHGFQMGRQQAKENALNKAYSHLAQNPDDPAGLEMLARVDGRAAMGAREDMDRRKQIELQRAAQMASTLGPVYQQLARLPYEQRRQWLQSVAPRLQARGIPAEMIASYDPTDEALQADLALSGQIERELMAVAPGTVVIDKSTGTQVFKNPDRTRYFPVPAGGMLVPEPGAGGQSVSVAPQPGHVEDGYRFKGGNPADPNAWEPVGGQTVAPSGPFQP